MRYALIVLCLSALSACAQTVVRTPYVVQVAEDGSTIPPNTIATPQQVETIAASADTTYAAATNLDARAAACAEKVVRYGSNYVVTSTVYVQSIGGVPFDPSNQTVTVRGIALDASNIIVTATVRQTPLVPPLLDWRVSLGSGGWSNIASTVTKIDIPAGVTNAAAAYTFALPRPSASAFFRVVDNSSGASGSGLWWLVYGGITVDGRRGLSGMVGDHRFVGGILVEPDPLGGY